MHDKINILFLTFQLETIGGSERLIYHLASNMDRNLFNPSVAWLDGNGVLKEFKELGIPLFPIRKKKRFDISTIRSVGDVIKSENIHVVNAHHFMPMIYAFYGCKVANQKTFFYTEHSQWEIQQIPWKWKKIGACILNKSDGAIGVNPQVSAEIQKKFGAAPEKVFTILNGVDVKSFQTRKNKSIIRAKIGLSPADRVIGIVANFKRVKNHLFLLKAFYELLKEQKEAKLLMIGEGYENDPENSEQEMRNYIKEKGLQEHALFLGYRTDISDILSVCDFFCLTSLKEGLPLSLIEAMAAGLPIIGTDVEGIRDVIIPDRNGFLIEIDDVAGLKKAMQALIQNAELARKFGRESEILAGSKYSLETCIEQYENLFLSRQSSRDNPVDVADFASQVSRTH